MKVLIQKNIKTIFLAVLLVKLFVLIYLINQLLYRGENAAYEFTKAILEEYKYCKKKIKIFNKNLIMTEDLFQKSNNCWICKKLIDNDDDKVRDHCHITGKFRGAVSKSCNLNFKLTKKVPVIFHNLKHYDSHLILMNLINLMQKLR